MPICEKKGRGITAAPPPSAGYGALQRAQSLFEQCIQCRGGILSRDRRDAPQCLFPVAPDRRGDRFRFRVVDRAAVGEQSFNALRRGRAALAVSEK